MGLRIALTGGIACGKSLLSRFLNDLGVETLDADDVVHEIIPDPQERRRIAREVFADPQKRRELEARLHPLVKERINAWFECQTGDGLATLPSGLASPPSPLSSAPSPLVARPSSVWPPSSVPSPAVARPSPVWPPSLAPSPLVARPSPVWPPSSAPSPAVARPSSVWPSIRIAIIPLLFETHWDVDYDIICSVVSSPEVQVERMTTMRGYTHEEAMARLKAQLPVEEKAARSHYVIRNDGSPDALRHEAEKFVAWLRKKESEHGR